MKDIHIGNQINKRLKELHLRPTDLAQRMEMSNAGITALLRKGTIQLDLLQRACVALEYDFFTLYCECPPLPEPPPPEPEREELDRALAASEAKVVDLEKEVGYLKKLVALYEKKG